MTRTELIIQLLKLAIGLAFGAYFVWWSLEVLNRLTPEDQVRAAVIDAGQGPQADPRGCDGSVRCQLLAKAAIAALAYRGALRR